METAIQIQNVWKIFGNNSKEALDAIQNKKISKQEALEKYNSVIGVSDVSFDVNKGEIFCVMGLSGSGKSTLVRHINRLLEPTSGKILINNQDVMQFDKDNLQELRNKKIGMVFQNFALMPHRSVLDNIAMPLEIRGISKNDRLDAANKILNIVELQGWGNKYAHELSGGMQQRVGLARALAADPEFLLMDEPFSALDPLIRRQLQSEFIKLSKQMKKTTVFITHDLDEAVRVGHRIAIMRDGAVVQIGTPEEIVVNPADEYVADFVKGISRLKVVQAKTIMKSIKDYENKFGSLDNDNEIVNENDVLSKLIETSISKDKPIVVKPVFSRHAETRMAQRGVQAQAVSIIINHGDRRIHVGSGLKSFSVSRQKADQLVRDEEIKPAMVERLSNLCVIVANDNNEAVVSVIHPTNKKRGRSYYNAKGYEPSHRRHRKRRCQNT